MLIKHSILNKIYNIDCSKYDIYRYRDLKSYLINIIDNVQFGNIKFFKNNKELKNETIIDASCNEIGMAIIPVVCCRHK